MVLTYMVTFAQCYSAFSLFVNHNSITFPTDEQMSQILNNISNDHYLCIHCVERHIEAKILNVIRKKENLTERRKYLQNIRISYNCLSLFNTIVVFIVFGGPLFTSIVGLFCCFFVVLSSCIEDDNAILACESSVVLFSAVVCFKSLYVLTFTICSIVKKKQS